MDVLFSNFINNFTKNSFLEAIGLVSWSLLLCFLTCTMAYVFFKLTKFVQKYILVKNDIDMLNNQHSQQASILYILFLTIVFVPFILIFALIPYSNGFIILNSNLSSIICLTFLLLSFASSLFLPLFTIHPKKIDCIKNIFKALIFFIPLNFSILSIIIKSSSFNLNDIIMSQVYNRGVSNWYLFNNPFGFLVFLLSTVFIMKYIYMNKTNSWNNYFNIFFLTLITFFAVTLFLGGYFPPFDFYFTNLFKIESKLITFLIFIEQFIWLIFKFVISEFAIILLYKKISKYDFPIKKVTFVLSAISILNFVIISIFKYFSTGGF